MGIPGGLKLGMPPKAPGAGPDIPICMLCPGSIGRMGPPAVHVFQLRPLSQSHQDTGIEHCFTHT